MTRRKAISVDSSDVDESTELDDTKKIEIKKDKSEPVAKTVSNVVAKSGKVKCKLLANVRMRDKYYTSGTVLDLTVDESDNLRKQNVLEFVD